MKLSREMQKVRHCCRTFIFPSLPDLPVFMQVKLKVSASAVNYLNSQVGATIVQPVQACELRSIRHLLGRAAGKPHHPKPKKKSRPEAR